jgi:D-amino-acid dehydrogenase
MHVCVFGGGVVGVTTAYLLAREGYRVTVIERNSESGFETSFANGGQLSYSYVAPLANPSVLGHLPEWLFSSTAPLLFQLSLDPSQWLWCLQFLRQCSTSRSRQTTIELLRLGMYSKTVMHGLLEDAPIDFAFSRSGKLVVYRNKQDFEGARRLMALQARFGTQQKALNASHCLDAEPALSTIAKHLVGGIYTESEDTGDCYRFTRELSRLAAERYGVQFLYNSSLSRLRCEDGRVVAAETSNGDVTADDYVVALGNESPHLLRRLGIRLPMYPLKGYSLTVPTHDSHHAPTISVTDLHHKIVYARLKDQVRIAGMVDMTPAGSVKDAARIRLLQSQAQQTMPTAGDYSQVRVWTGARPTTPDSKPLLGPTRIANLWLNTGHGSLGFTFAAGTAKLLVDALSQRASELDLAPFMLDGRNRTRSYPLTAIAR